MNSFAYITSNFFPETDILKVAFAFPDSRSSVINTDFISYGFLNSLHFGKSKFSVLESSLLSNMYIKQSQKESMLDIFTKAQRTYHGFARLALLYKVKHSKRYNVDTDLYFNSLTSLSDKILTDVYDDKTRVIYKFRISDIIGISRAALSNAPSFFSEPLTIKNPYTNVPFTLSQLYHLYFVIKESSYVMPSLFHHFFELGFNIEIFSNACECLIRDESLKIFLSTSTHEQKYFHIMKMITHYEGHLENINIHPLFPITKLVEGLSHFLKDYLYGVYSLNPTLRFQAKRRLTTSLLRFNKLNPSYGRKIFRRNRFTDTSIDSSGELFNIYSPTNSYHSDPRPGRENLSFRFVDDIVTEPRVITPRQVSRRQRLRQRGFQPTSPGRRVNPPRLGPPRLSPSGSPRTRYSQVAVQASYSPRNYLVDEETDTMDDNTDNTDNTDNADNTDDEPSIGQDVVAMDISVDEDIRSPISRRYDGVEELDHESEDRTIDNHITGHLMNLEDGTDDMEMIVENLVSFERSERLADIASPDWPTGLGTPSDGESANGVGVVDEDDGIRHTHEDVDAPDDLTPESSEGLSDLEREIVNATITDIFDNIDDAMTDIIGHATSPPVPDNFVTSIPVAPHSRLMHPQSPLPPPPSLPIPPRRMSGIMFPPPPALPIPRRTNTAISLEYELSNRSTIIPPDSSDDD